MNANKLRTELAYNPHDQTVSRQLQAALIIINCTNKIISPFIQSHKKERNHWNDLQPVLFAIILVSLALRTANVNQHSRWKSERTDQRIAFQRPEFITSSEAIFESLSESIFLFSCVSKIYWQE